MLADELDEGASANMLRSQHKYESNGSNGLGSPMLPDNSQ